MLYPLQQAGEEAVLLPPLPQDRSPAARFLELAAGLNALFDETPNLLRMSGGASLTLLYRDAAYRWQDIFDCVGSLAAALSPNIPLTFFGTTQTRETAEFTISPGGLGKGQVSLRSVSGKSFDLLQGLGVRLELLSPEAAAQWADLAAALPRRGPCGVLPGRYGDFLAGCGLLLPARGSLFAYLAWTPVSPPQALAALDCAHKAELWRAFLLEGRQSLEFDWLWQHYYTGQALFLLEWELALQAVLEELGFRVERGEASFRVTDREGRQRRFDFARGGPAEKLFLKLMFPLDGR